MTESFNTKGLDKDDQQRLYDQAWHRGFGAGNDLNQAYIEDINIGTRTVSSTPLLEAIHDVSLKETIKLNPNTSPEHKAQMMKILERIRESEARKANLRRKRSGKV